MKAETRIQELYKLAGKRSRKQLEKELNKSRRDYNAARTNHERASSQMASHEQEVDKLKEMANSARKSILELSDHIRTMDLTGAHTVKNHGDEHGYFMGDGKEYHTDISDVNDIKCVPWKNRPKKEDVHKSDDKPRETREGYDLDIAFAVDDPEGVNLTIVPELSEEKLTASFRAAINKVNKFAGR